MTLDYIPLRLTSEWFEVGKHILGWNYNREVTGTGIGRCFNMLTPKLICTQASHPPKFMDWRRGRELKKETHTP